MKPGALFHYRINFMIYFMTLLFSMTQVVQGSLFFIFVSLFDFAMMILLWIIIVRDNIRQDIKSLEDDTTEYENADEVT